MQIFVKTLTGKYLTIEIERNEKVERIKEIIHNKEGIPIEFITLIRRGKFLNDQKLLIDYDIQKEETLHLLIRRFYLMEVSKF